MFGIKNATKRKQLDFAVKGDPYRHYKNVGDSIRDYLQYLDKHYPDLRSKNTITGFVEGLKERDYFGAESKEYIDGVKRNMS